MYGIFFKNVFLLICLASYLNASNLEFKDCGSEKGLIESVEILGCKKSPCSLVKGTDVEFNLKFVTSLY